MRKAMVIGVIIAAGIAIVVWMETNLRKSAQPVSTVSPPTQPATQPTTAPVAVVHRLTSYIDVVRAENPAVPATQPLSVPADLPDAAHLILHEPIYLDPSGHLWITRADANPTDRVLQKTSDSTEHVIPDRPVFAHWMTDDAGNWSAQVITRRSPNDGGGFDIISSLERRKLADVRPYRWESAFSWNGKIVVPTDTGVSVFDIEPNIVEHYHALPGLAAGASMPIVVLDSRGLLAWAPWDNGKPGSRGASRFVDGNWTDLTGDQWPEKIIQLQPLLDGSILQIIAGYDDHVTLTIAPLETGDIDQKHVAELVDNLADPDEDKRQAAFAELSQYGPGLWPILEKMADDQPAEARVRIKQLLRSKIAPALGGMTVMENRLSTVRRQSDGTTIFFAPVGISIPNGDRDPQTVTPAWICIRPGGRVDRALPAALVKDITPENCPLIAEHDDWVICDDAGPRRFFGNAWVPLVNANERQFNYLVGEDHRGRWLFRQSIATTTQPGTKIGTGAIYFPGDTLIVDPTILDPTPKLPVWTMTILKGEVGWNAADFPVIKRGGPWALKADAWEALDPKEKIFTDTPPAPDTNPPASTQPTTGPALGPPLLTTTDGTRYFGGLTDIVMIEKSGEETRWSLPPTAVGSSDPTLLRTADGLLFLYNQPGRMLRIKPTPGGTEPFTLETTFTTDIPDVDHLTRIWLDPLGRIDFAFDGNKLAIMFPGGHIPEEISRMMADQGP
jgi:hypothetical protein